ncbi:unnamed protein product [Paramecium octaurelia]|uniref:Uncharacterized protein n=1 Tax=Paramecium octaurelia TaxID=43137 RepID=A0A8S1UDK6_PAROT|nr:unnamed protein product [Paramecium octaurelia]
MLKLHHHNGNFKLELRKALKQEIICGWQDIIQKELGKNLESISTTILNQYQVIGMEVELIAIIRQRIQIYCRQINAYSQRNHLEMIRLYGQKNELTLRSRHETGKYDQFTWGDGSRGSSVRVPIITKELGQGYFEDRRPAANIDPYLVSAALVDVTCLNSEHLKQLNSIFQDSLKPQGQQIFQIQEEQFQQQKE